MKCYVFWLTSVILMFNILPYTLAQPEYPSYPTEIHWSPNGSHVSVSGYGFLQVFETSTGSLVLDVPVGDRNVSGHTWDGDGRRLAYVDGNALRIWDVESRLLLFETDVRSRAYGLFLDVDWSSDGSTLVTSHLVGGTNPLFLWDTQSFEILNVVQATLASHIELSPNGTQAAISSSGYAGAIINLTTGETSSFQRDDAVTATYTWNNDGTQLAVGYVDGQIVILDVEKQTGVRTLRLEDPDNFFDIAWSRDDNYLAVVTGDFSVQTWDIQSSEVLYETQPFTSSTADFSPFGGRLAFSSLSSPSEIGAGEEVTSITQDNARILGGGLIQVVVPDASRERLQTIQTACGLDTTRLPEFQSAQSAELSTYTEQIQALPTETIPPACAADLIAVAEAIQAQEQE